MSELQFVSKSPEHTRSLGFIIGKYSQPGDVMLLSGDLGTGKTCLTQGIADGMGVEGYVRSPTFVLVTIHQGRIPLYHMDLYRMDSSAEVIDLGIDEYLYGDGLSAVVSHCPGFGGPRVMDCDLSALLTDFHLALNSGQHSSML